MGIGAVKIRVKYDTLEEDLAIVRGVREAAGDGFTIGVDANQGWPVSLFRRNPDWDLERASAFARGCDDLGVAWLEEPLDMHDWQGMAELRRRVKTPIAGGELHGGWHELLPLFEHESLDNYQPDAMFCGLTVSRRVMAGMPAARPAVLSARLVERLQRRSSTCTPLPRGSRAGCSISLRAARVRARRA